MIAWKNSHLIIFVNGEYVKLLRLWFPKIIKIWKNMPHIRNILYFSTI